MKQTNQYKNKDICVGVITAVSGVKGYVKIRSFTADPKDITDFQEIYDQDGNKFKKISVVVEKKDYIIAGIAGISNRNEAEKLRNTRLFINRSALPAPANEEYYHADLIGLDAQYEDGTACGVVKNVFNFGAGDILEIYDMISEKTIYHPFNKQFVSNIDLAANQITIVKIEETVAAKDGL